MSGSDVVVLALYYSALALLAVYGLHRLYLVRLRHRLTDPRPRAAPARWPSVTIQLPVYNEPDVVVRLLEAAAAIEYPGHLDIQLLDDSTDQTTALVTARIADLCQSGRHIEHIRRPARDGFKAGALANGMALSKSDLFAIFDADFVPAPDVLLRMVPAFGDPSVGMVQARWGHLNRHQSLLTAVQAIYLDGHFAIESTGRCFSGRFFNFNGAAGVWRREAIAAGGGWSAATLTEDLDLSYRAQLAGWRFVFLPEVEICAELPASLGGFQEQQHRWAKGSIQTARHVLPSLMRRSLPAAVKAEAWFHLTSNFAYALISLVALLVVPAILIRQRHSIGWTVLIDLALITISTGSVLHFYIAGQRFAGRARPPHGHLLATLPIGIAISLRNTSAVLEGLFMQGGYFRRTPKTGWNAGPMKPAVKPVRWPVAEFTLTLFFTGAIIAFLMSGQWLALPLLSLFLAGYGYAAGADLYERLAD